MKTDIVVKDQARAAQAATRMIHRKDGSLVIPIQYGLYDIFQGDGWDQPSRFRIVKFKGTKGATRQLIQVSGNNLSTSLREQLLKEL